MGNLKQTEIDLQLLNDLTTDDISAGPGFDHFWPFAVERWQIYLRRQAGQKPPWTQDSVLANYRFTNVFRVADRVSQYLISEVQTDRDWPWPETFARTLVFKMFNSIPTWQYLKQNLGEITGQDLLGGRIGQVMARRRSSGQTVYNPAYIMPPIKGFPGPKYAGHLDLIKLMVKEDVPYRIKRAGSFQKAFRILKSYPGIGNFLAYQLMTDLNYSKHLSYDSEQFVVAGPGAARGLRKCFFKSDLSESQLIAWVTLKQTEELRQRKLPEIKLRGNKLKLMDVQNIFCEFDKYSRLALPGLAYLAPGKRIKQRFRAEVCQSVLTANLPEAWSD